MRLEPDDEDEEDLDAEFPLGDGTADTSDTVTCPYCSASVGISVDPGSGTSQEYVEDCEVCCQPWQVTVRYGRGGSAEVSVTQLDE